MSSICITKRYKRRFITKEYTSCIFSLAFGGGLLTICLTTMLFALALPAATQAQEAQRCFAETGFCISGAIRTYWEQNGGLAVFGYPISTFRTETLEGNWTGPVQWFERDRLENHADEDKGVLAGRLGARLLELQGRPWVQGPGYPPNPECTFFQATGYNACGAFRAFWQRNGGLERFGYPISEPVDETIEGRTYTVQYFERRRMEYHPENAGTAYEVLLGLLGRDVYAQSASVSCPNIPAELRHTWETYASDLGCGQVYGNGQVAMQSFEHGVMVWVGRADGGHGQIFVLVGDPNNNAVWDLYVDWYVEGEPVGTDELPPPGKLAPTRGFGKIWYNVSEVRQALGWAVAPEQGDTGTVLQFSVRGGFSWMIHRKTTDRVYIMRANGPATDVPR